MSRCKQVFHHTQLPFRAVSLFVNFFFNLIQTIFNKFFVKYVCQSSSSELVHSGECYSYGAIRISHPFFYSINCNKKKLNASYTAYKGFKEYR